jgi:hypothetical protein
MLSDSNFDEIEHLRAVMRDALELLLLRCAAPNDPRVELLEARVVGYLVPRRPHQG